MPLSNFDSYIIIILSNQLPYPLQSYLAYYILTLFTSTVAATSFTSTATYFNTDFWTDGTLWYQSFLN